MARTPQSRPCRYVLDTSVLMHDPTALFRFQEHDVVLPMAVLEELDHAKKGVSEVARNVRQVSRFLDELLRGAGRDELEQGLPLTSAGEAGSSGRLYFDQSRGARGDEAILESALALQRDEPERRLTLVSKDINLRIRATVLGLHAEDYFNDQVLDDLDLLYTGAAALPLERWQAAVPVREDGRELYRLKAVQDWHLNQCLYVEGDDFEGVVRRLDQGEAWVERLTDYRGGDSIWGVHARNREQNFALNLLLDPQIDFVSMLGAAGTGKTLLTLAAGLAQTLDSQRFREIIMTRVTVPLGEDIGYLPGTEEEKMTPWMGALMDNLEVLTQSETTAGGWARAATQDVLQSRIKIRSLNFMRGRTFFNRYIILDEAQNLTAKQMKALVTRAGPGSKIVCLGNIAQIDTPYLTETSSGLTYVIDRFKDWAHSGHVTLLRGERSRLADFATQAL